MIHNPLAWFTNVESDSVENPDSVKEKGNAKVCFAFPTDELSLGFKDNEKTTALISTLLEYFGRENMTIFHSSTKKQIFVVVKPLIHLLMAKADKIGLKVLLDADELTKCAATGIPDKKIAPITFGNNPG